MKLLEQAINYAELGFYILPCRNKHGGSVLSSKGKWIELLPKAPLIPNGLNSATRDLSQIEKWWKRWPNAMIGCNLELSGFFVVDLDNHKESANGIENWLKLGINDEGTLKVLTPNRGMHIYFSGHGKTHTNEDTGVDSRGDGSYSILPNSFIEYPDGTKKSYVALTDMSINPIPVTPQLFETLNPVKKKKSPPVRLHKTKLTQLEEFEQAKKLVWKIPFNVIDNYSDWIRIGLYLKKFGDEGKDLFFKWTNEKYLSLKPNSKRQDLEYKWDSFNDVSEEITIGTLRFYVKEYGEK